MTRTRWSIAAGKSVVMAVDVPGYTAGARAELFGKSVSIPIGAAKLAGQTGAPILIAVPWASNPRKPYNISIKRIESSGVPQIDMRHIADHIEKVLRRNPACWNGWLYLDKMQESGES